MSNNDFGNVPNPYQSTAPVPLQTPPALKPASITVFGILNLVFGILGLCGTAVTSVQMFVLSAQQDIANPVLEQMQQNKAYFGFMLVSLAVGFIATIALIVAGIGLLNGKPYGRTLSIGYGLYGIVAGILGIVFNAVFLFRPLIEQAAAMPEGPEKRVLSAAPSAAPSGEFAA